jgi:hypothetical protein
VLYSCRQRSIRIWASQRVKDLPINNSSRSFPLKLSQYPFSHFRVRCTASASPLFPATSSEALHAENLYLLAEALQKAGPVNEAHAALVEFEQKNQWRNPAEKITPVEN